MTELVVKMPTFDKWRLALRDHGGPHRAPSKVVLSSSEGNSDEDSEVTEEEDVGQASPLPHRWSLGGFGDNDADMQPQASSPQPADTMEEKETSQQAAQPPAAGAQEVEAMFASLAVESPPGVPLALRVGQARSDSLRKAPSAPQAAPGRLMRALVAHCRSPRGRGSGAPRTTKHPGPFLSNAPAIYVSVLTPPPCRSQGGGKEKKKNVTAEAKVTSVLRAATVLGHSFGGCGGASHRSGVTLGRVGATSAPNASPTPRKGPIAKGAAAHPLMPPAPTTKAAAGQLPTPLAPTTKAAKFRCTEKEGASQPLSAILTPATERCTGRLMAQPKVVSASES